MLSVRGVEDTARRREVEEVLRSHALQHHGEETTHSPTSLVQGRQCEGPRVVPTRSRTRKQCTRPIRGRPGPRARLRSRRADRTSSAATLSTVETAHPDGRSPTRFSMYALSNSSTLRLGKSAARSSSPGSSPPGSGRALCAMTDGGGVMTWLRLALPAAS